MQQYTIGVDIGTGSAKAVAIDILGNVLSSFSCAYQTTHFEPGASEQDPENIWQAFVQSIADCVLAYGQPQTIGLSSAMHSLILADDRGHALTPMMTWADRRSEHVAADLLNKEAGARLYRLTGTPIHPMSPLCKIIWLRSEHPDIFQGATRFMSIKDFIWFRLFRHFEADFSVASASGLFDILDLCWNAEACTIAGITTTQLPDLKNTDYSRLLTNPALLERIGLNAPLRFFIGASDGCCANLGTHVHGSHKAALSIGTSGAVRVTGTTPIYHDDVMIFNYRLDEHTFVSGGAVNNGGNTVNWLLKKFMDVQSPDDTDYEKLFLAAETVATGSDGLLFLPYIHGERAPIWNAEATGAFLNIRASHTQQHFLKAGLEGICLALYDVLKNIEDISCQIRELHVSGGFTTSNSWMQLIADVTGKPLLVMHNADASAVGAAYLVMRQNHPEAYSQLCFRAPQQIITPDLKKHEIYLRTFYHFRKSYTLLKTIWD